MPRSKRFSKLVVLKHVICARLCAGVKECGLVHGVEFECGVTGMLSECIGSINTGAVSATVSREAVISREMNDLIQIPRTVILLSLVSGISRKSQTFRE